MTEATLQPYSENCYAVLVDADCYEPRIKRQEHIVLDPSLSPKIGDLVLAGKIIGTLTDLEDEVTHFDALHNGKPHIYQGVPHVIVGIYLRRP